MSNSQTRNSVLALKKETTEGTPVVPSAGTDFVTLQDGFTLDPTFNLLENKELRGSIGKAKPITGLEQPKANFSHYIRHSGVEGQAPDFKELLESLFGLMTVTAAEDVTIVGSTVSAVNVGVGKGADFARGKVLLVKDGTNGYSLRPVLSVTGDVLTLGFNIPVAPGTGIALGKSVLFSPVNTGHPTLTVWQYRGNGGAIEAIAGCRVTDLSIDAKAGELIDGAFSIEGVRYYFDPINVVSTNNKLDFSDSAATALTATIAAAVYRDPADFAQAVQDAMNSLGSADTFAVVWNNSGAKAGKFTISSSGTILALKWNTGAHTANSIAATMGFSTAADSTGALTYDSLTVQSWSAPFTPAYDNSDPLVAKDNEVLLGGPTDNLSFSVSQLQAKITNTKSNIPDVTSSSGISGSVINQRHIEVTLTALMQQHDADKFERFRTNKDTAFMFNAGVKSGGNWVPGKCFSIYLPTCAISSFKATDLSGLVAIDLTLSAFVDSQGNGEVYLNFL